MKKSSATFNSRKSSAYQAYKLPLVLLTPKLKN
jgi:hypothetical protein